MKRVIILISIILLSNILFAKYPRVYVSVKPKDITPKTKVQVILVAVAKKGSKIVFPKIDKIAKYNILSKKANVTYSIAESDGNKTAIVKRAVTHIIKPDSSFDVNSFVIKIDNKEYKTTPFKVNVKEPKNIKNKEIKEIDNNRQKENISQNRDNSSPIIFKMTSNKKSVVVGESFIIKVELFEPINLSNSDIQYTPPKFKDFNVQALGDGKIIDKGNSVIRTIEYIATAKKSGLHIIKPAIAKIAISLAPQAQSPFGFFGADIQWKSISSNPLKIDVKELPEHVELVGSFRIKVIRESNFAKANKPFKYTIVIDGLGNIDNIKDPKFNIKGVTSYSNDAKIEHIASKGKIYSKYSKKYVFISDRDFTIPSIEYKVYSPKSNKVYIIKTEPFNVKVKRSKSITEALNGIKSDVEKALKNPKSMLKEQEIPKDNFEKEDKELAKIEDLLFDNFYYKRKYSIEGYPFVALFGAFILGLILGMGGVLLGKSILNVIKKATNRDKNYTNYEEALALLYPHITKSKEIENMVENLYEVVNGNRDLKIDNYALKRMIKKVTKNKI